MEQVYEVESPTCKTIVNTEEITREEWLDLRMTGIGGSDAAGCFNPPMSRYTSPMIVTMSKLGLLPPINDNDYMKHGRRMEPVLRQEFAELYRETTGTEIQVYKSPFMYRSIEYPHMLANIDGIAVLPDGRVAGLEIKTGGSSKEWKDDEVPDAYYCQMQHYMAILGLDLFFSPFLIDRHFEYREVPRNDSFIMSLIDAENNVWEYVQRKEIPAPVGIEAESDAIDGQYPNGSGAIINAPEFALLAEEYAEIKNELSRLKAKKEAFEVKVKAHMKEAKVCRMGNHEAVWLRYEQNRIDSDTLKRQQPEIYRAYSKTIQTGRFTIS